MEIITKRYCIRLLMLSIAIAVPVAGCEMIEEQTGLDRPTQWGTAGGAAFGGIVAALANANPAWIAASTILGGVTGGAIGNALGKEDATTHTRRNLEALDALAEGQTSSWSNSKTGNSGSTTVRRVALRADGTVCKLYTESIRTGVETITRDAYACKAPGGTWTVQTT